MSSSQAQHPDQLRLEAYADGTPRDDERVVGEHVDRCAECAAYVRRIRSLAEALHRLPATARRIPPVERSIARRIAERPRVERWMSASPLKAAAAALVIFGAGLATGIATTRGAPAESSPPPTDIREALDVQRAGTSYIAALAKLNATMRDDDARVVYGREVALATLYGAAAEAVGPLGPDPAASELLTLARTVRERAAQSSSTERLP
ncbi:MAG: anti-sigma factor family protein [Gemmatimonadaceae bacterium]